MSKNKGMTGQQEEMEVRLHPLKVRAHRKECVCIYERVVSLCVQYTFSIPDIEGLLYLGEMLCIAEQKEVVNELNIHLKKKENNQQQIK